MKGVGIFRRSEPYFNQLVVRLSGDFFENYCGFESLKHYQQRGSAFLKADTFAAFVIINK